MIHIISMLKWEILCFDNINIKMNKIKKGIKMFYLGNYLQ